MKRKQFTPTQIIQILREAKKNEQPLAELCRKHGISDATFYRWRKHYQGLTVSEVKRLRGLSTENGWLKKLLAERDLEIDALKQLLAKKW